MMNPEQVLALGLFIGVLIVWFIVPIFVCASLTRSKGVGDGLGVVLGLFLGWLGVLLCLFIPYKPIEYGRRRRRRR
ncbi:MAG: hypothetical protein DRH30_07870 [Deltaproteobacteria bacterium]|nr:MAG: hypothetical protein DRH30_07870 [Deltaproteobacteria bacterium]